MNLQLATKLGALEGNTIGRCTHVGAGQFPSMPISQSPRRDAMLVVFTVKYYVDFMLYGLIDFNLISMQI